jgi:hypothetical protein
VYTSSRFPGKEKRLISKGLGSLGGQEELLIIAAVILFVEDSNPSPLQEQS